MFVVDQSFFRHFSFFLICMDLLKVSFLRPEHTKNCSCLDWIYPRDFVFLFQKRGQNSKRPVFGRVLLTLQSIFGMTYTMFRSLDVAMIFSMYFPEPFWFVGITFFAGVFFPKRSPVFRTDSHQVWFAPPAVL